VEFNPISKHTYFIPEGKYAYEDIIKLFFQRTIVKSSFSPDNDSEAPKNK
jgi:hypothetical protein